MRIRSGERGGSVQIGFKNRAELERLVALLRSLGADAPAVATVSVRALPGRGLAPRQPAGVRRDLMAGDGVWRRASVVSGRRICGRAAASADGVGPAGWALGAVVITRASAWRQAAAGLPAGT